MQRNAGTPFQPKGITPIQGVVFIAFLYVFVFACVVAIPRLKNDGHEPSVCKNCITNSEAYHHSNITIFVPR